MQGNNHPIEAPLGLICGGGHFPSAVAKAAVEAGRSVFIMRIAGTEAEGLSDYKGTTIRLGEVGRIIKTLRDMSIKDVCLIGHLPRPQISDLRPDWGAVRYIPDFVPLFSGGDNHLLSGVIRFLERRGFQVLAAHHIAPSLVLGEKHHAGPKPTTSEKQDIEKGFELLAALSSFDVGQGVLVRSGRIIAVEGAEGTDGMLARAKDLGKAARGAVLVKAPKVGQDWRVDLPAVGPQTVLNAAEAGLAGIAVAAGAVMMVQKAEALALAKKSKVFVVGQKDPRLSPDTQQEYRT
jgi:UDP-2,3-diacylglucosamine hydrolase